MDQSETRNLRVVGHDNPNPFLQPIVFFSMAALPKTAGRASLRFGNEKVQWPERHGPSIFLPSVHGELSFYVLQGGERFLVRFSGRNYFGGTDADESIFLTEVTEEAFQMYLEHGDYGFYESLKPAELKVLEKEWPNAILKRQGDVFAFWCSEFGEDFKELGGYIFACAEEFKKRCIFETCTGDAIPFADTRHVINGGLLAVSTWNEAYAFGTVSAPDHRPLVLGDRPHRLFRATNLVRPRNGGCGDR